MLASRAMKHIAPFLSTISACFISLSAICLSSPEAGTLFGNPTPHANEKNITEANAIVEKLEAILKEEKASIEKNKGKTTELASLLDLIQYCSNYYSEIPTCIKQSDYRKALNYIEVSRRHQNNGHAIPNEFTEAQTQLFNLLTQLEQASEQALKKHLTNLQNELGNKLLEFKEPVELDHYFVKISNLIKSNNRRDPYLANELDSLRSIVSGWQEYLSHLKNNDLNQAKRTLDQLDRYFTTTPIIPRSKLLEMKSQLQNSLNGTPNVTGEEETPLEYTSTAAILSKYQSLDELPIVKKHAQSLSASGPSSERSDANELVKQCKVLMQTHELIEIGDVALAINKLTNLRSSRFPEWREKITLKLKENGIKKLTPESLKPEVEGKSLLTKLEIISQHLNEQQEWQQLWAFNKNVESILFLNSYGVKNITWFSNDIKAIELFIAGTRYERAGEYASAITKYQKVLDLIGKYGPYDEAGEAMKNLRATADQDVLTKQLEEKTKSDASYYNSRMIGTDRFHKRNELIDAEFQRKAKEAVEDRLSLYLKSDEEKAQEEKK